MTSPVLLVMAEEAPVVSAELARLCPGERFVLASNGGDLARLLSEETPEAAFLIRSNAFAMADYLVLRDAPSLRWLHNGGSGYEHLLDGGGWDPARLVVTNSTGVLAPFLADTCMAAILAFNQDIFGHLARQKTKTWGRTSFPALAGQVLLIAGAGAIGTQLALRAKAFGLHVIGIRRNAAEVPEGYDEMHPPGALMDLLPRADIVSSHLRLDPSTAGIFDARAFAAMKEGALFMNTGRGGLVVEQDLMAGLAAGRPGRAYLDVFAEEPLPPDNPLWDCPNLLISPHSSDGVEDWELRFTRFFAANLAAWRSGAKLRNIVNP